MKLASLKSGRDGKLVVVSRDLKKMTEAVAIAPTLQAALDEWRLTAPQLEKLYDDIAIGGMYSSMSAEREGILKIDGRTKYKSQN